MYENQWLTRREKKKEELKTKELYYGYEMTKELYNWKEELYLY